MATWPTYDEMTEQELREEMFDFHPQIKAQATPLPRRTDGRQYTAPASSDTPTDPA
ncbi:hypothetical protein Xcel_3405 (plasmid) [Xylanimonas cellulosilytica DSM 15894]|uniref:Uncharacterized protein n=1 Tax=Xylanimonas cellulosilytica (strain DSM 15894 / JCM 12276 / CECT 5975 / KCTC 9989 / LMG 20990 / NBRC 107835 / XIL07) TaxID=446471 RepID=D1C0T8_XYLCX|nr:hypothetical protein [Xylanimonas cellulosilytica]ACZ32404.1 hypothetical protein Xcel_3405 [Xylanimonas cellulosilytica DSM 15894]